jgi:hypothetical protein
VLIFALSAAATTRPPAQGVHRIPAEPDRREARRARSSDRGETAAFGDYAKHYATIADFNGNLDQVCPGRCSKRSPGDAAFARRGHGSAQDVAAVGEEWRIERRSINDRHAAHALKQPDDLKPVYDAAYARTSMPARRWPTSSRMSTRR